MCLGDVPGSDVDDHVTNHDFNRAIMSEVAHRPWSMPDESWVMTQTWHDLLFAHWPIDEGALREKVPSEFDLDLFDGTGWVGVVLFHMTNVAPRGVPSLPWISEFPELNVRTYVRVNDKPGIYFFSLDAGSTLAVHAARLLLNLPYYAATMSVMASADNIQYDSRRDNDSATATLSASYRPIGAPFEAIIGRREHFLTERYSLFVRRAGIVTRLDIEHVPWPLQHASADIDVNTMAQAAGFKLPAAAPHILFSRRLDVVANWPRSA